MSTDSSSESMLLFNFPDMDATAIFSQLCTDWREGRWRKVCKSCKMASTSSRLAPDLASMTLSSHSWSSVVNAEANTVISSSDSSRVSNRTLATSFSAILMDDEGGTMLQAAPFDSDPNLPCGRGG